MNNEIIVRLIKTELEYGFKASDSTLRYNRYQGYGRKIELGEVYGNLNSFNEVEYLKHFKANIEYINYEILSKFSNSLLRAILLRNDYKLYGRKTLLSLYKVSERNCTRVLNGELFGEVEYKIKSEDERFILMCILK
jgi:hypothetical protein